MADDLHDSLSGKLSLIALTAQKAQRQSNDPLWKQINALSLESLDDVHRIIDTLDQKQPAIQDAHREAEASFTASLSKLYKEQDARLHAAGFTGSGILIGENTPAAITEKAASCMLGLVQEMYANVIRHADPAQPYSITVSISPYALEVTQVNNQRADDTLSHGHGLAQYEKAIKRLGGNMRRQNNGNRWVCFCHIPLDVTAVL